MLKRTRIRLDLAAIALRIAADTWAKALKMPVLEPRDRAFHRADKKLQRAALKYAKICEQVRK